MKIGSSSTYFEMLIIKRENPDSNDYYDVNWLETKISLKGNQWEFSANANVLVMEIISLKNLILDLLKSSKKEIIFSNLENDLNIVITKSDDNEFSANFSVTNNFLMIKKTIRLIINFDELKTFLDQLAKSLQEFPIMGKEPKG